MVTVAEKMILRETESRSCISFPWSCMHEFLDAQKVFVMKDECLAKDLPQGSIWKTHRSTLAGNQRERWSEKVIEQARVSLVPALPDFQSMGADHTFAFPFSRYKFTRSVLILTTTPSLSWRDSPQQQTWAHSYEETETWPLEFQLCSCWVSSVSDLQQVRYMHCIALVKPNQIYIL